MNKYFYKLACSMRWIRLVIGLFFMQQAIQYREIVVVAVFFIFQSVLIQDAV
jgi:hypothetical protein